MERAPGLDRAVEQSHDALAAIIRGDVSGYADLYSEQDDITIGNPFGPFARGRAAVIATGEGLRRAIGTVRSSASRRSRAT